MDTPETTPQPSGLGAALGAYVIWGFLPLYLILVRSVPAVEFVGWRIIFTLPICLIIVAFRRQAADVLRALRNRRVMLTLTASALLVGLNWLVYVWAIQKNYVYAASLGYYINPLVNVLLGTILLKEKLSRAQWVAVALAASGVALLLGGALTTLWISLTLALSFGTYGLLRKQVDVGSLPGLTIESAILLLPAAGIAWWFAASAQGTAIDDSLSLTVLIAAGGALTAFPLLLFAIAARRMSYSTLGFIQFLAPTIVFILGLTVFEEELKLVQLACFILIWTAAAIFIWDLWSRRERAARPANAVSR
ncbi:EamA family transporter RarD [Altererythrobacter sp. SALINAS58]|uniref:EamA family transporter RarD n=1 Tax=Alteripontixanthobacter muriae TaxID=2705546 RepID=UPI001575DAE7|nr:EamA family transporter RarD [Alteripontixanthobacter muriae]NTZ42487.1 EamA family transporter RarD [Alteripontixanthobacter muriae]